MKKINKKAFSILEILVWMVIFFFWITAIYSTIDSIITRNASNKSSIIWINLAREQMELFRFHRDSNFANLRWFNIISCNDDDCKKFEVDKIYKVSQDLNSDTDNDVKFEWFSDNNDVEKMIKQKNFSDSEVKKFEICLINEENYDYCPDIIPDNMKRTRIYKFLKFLEVSGDDLKEYGLQDSIDKVLKVKSKVMWYSKKSEEFEIVTIFTDYKY